VHTSNYGYQYFFPAIKFQIKPEINEMIPIVHTSYIVFLCMNQMIGINIPPIKLQMTPDIDETKLKAYNTCIIIFCLCQMLSINTFSCD
jgi:hypothetical protein